MYILLFSLKVMYNIMLCRVYINIIVISSILIIPCVWYCTVYIITCNIDVTFNESILFEYERNYNNLKYYLAKCQIVFHSIIIIVLHFTYGLENRMNNIKNCSKSILIAESWVKNLKYNLHGNIKSLLLEL